MKWGSAVIRTYSFTYTYSYYGPRDNKYWQTMELASVQETGRNDGPPGTPIDSLPFMNFTYVDKVNASDQGDGYPTWIYPRLQTISNGWGGVATYEYQDDGRWDARTWANYHVSTFTIFDGVAHGNDMVTSFNYANPCYDDGVNPDGCNTDTYAGGLVGYDTVTAINKTSSTANPANAILGSSVHYFIVNRNANNIPAYMPAAGTEWETIQRDPYGNQLSLTYTNYQSVTLGPTGGPNWYFVYPWGVDEYGETTYPNTRLKQTQYDYEITPGDLLGNLKNKIETIGGYDVYHPPYRTTHYEYLSNSAAGIRNKVWQETVHAGDGNGTVISQISIWI